MNEKYELAILAKPLLPEDIKTKVIKLIEDMVKEAKGKLTPKIEDQWGKKHLAYPIKKNEEGYYCFFTLELDPAKLDEFEKDLNLIQDLLRFLIIREENL